LEDETFTEEQAEQVRVEIYAMNEMNREMLFGKLIGEARTRPLTHKEAYTLHEILENIVIVSEKTGKEEEAIGMLEALESLKINTRFKQPLGYDERLNKAVIRISNKTHNFPHSLSCSSCEDGWDMEIAFLIKELKSDSKLEIFRRKNNHMLSEQTHTARLMNIPGSWKLGNEEKHLIKRAMADAFNAGKAQAAKKQQSKQKNDTKTIYHTNIA